MAKLNSLRRTALDLWQLTGDLRPRLPLLVAGFIVVSLLDLLGIGLMAPFVSLTLRGGATAHDFSRITEMLGTTSSEMRVMLAGFVLIAVFAVKALSGILINRAVIHTVVRIVISLRQRLVQRFLAMPYEAYVQRNSSEYITLIGQKTQLAAYGGLLVALRLISESIVLGAIVVFLAFLSPKAVLLLLLLLAVFASTFMRLVRLKAIRLGKVGNTSAKALAKSVSQVFIGLKEVRILGGEDYFVAAIDHHAKAGASAEGWLYLPPIMTRYALEVLFITYVVLFSGLSVIGGDSVQSMLPVMATFGVAAMRLMPSMSTILAGINQLQYSAAAIRELAVECDGDQFSRPAYSGYVAKPKPFRKIELRAVTYRYPSAMEDTLTGVNLVVRAGDSIGLIGSSGSGKTTLLDVLLGLLPPSSGNIWINDRLLSREVLADWRQNVAYLPQILFMMDDSLRRNVALGVRDSDIDESRVLRAIEQARLREWLSTLPKGLDTKLGESGIRVSGGQRQRIALARAFYHDRNVLILDESTSALDVETEREVVDEISQLRGSRTLIVISHRPSTLQHCDRVYTLKNGLLLEEASASV